MAIHTRQGQQGCLALFDLQGRQASTAFTACRSSGRPLRFRTKGGVQRKAYSCLVHMMQCLTMHAGCFQELIIGQGKAPELH